MPQAQNLPARVQVLLWRCSHPARCCQALLQARPGPGLAAARLPAAGRALAQPQALRAGPLEQSRARLPAALRATAQRRWREQPPAALQPLRAHHMRSMGGQQEMAVAGAA